MKWLFVLIILLAGCSSQITDLGEILPKQEQPVNFTAPSGKKFKLRDENKTLDSFLRYHFTDEDDYRWTGHGWRCLSSLKIRWRSVDSSRTTLH